MGTIHVPWSVVMQGHPISISEDGYHVMVQIIHSDVQMSVAFIICSTATTCPRENFLKAYYHYNWPVYDLLYK